jgi:hypothetical protein
LRALSVALRLGQEREVSVRHFLLVVTVLSLFRK